MAPDYSPETRQDPITQQWVACAPARSSRPQKTTAQSPSSPPDSTPVEGCPFCPGHEQMLPTILWQLDANDDRPWHTRVVPNKFPALTPQNPPREQNHGLYQSRTSYGQQEVVIDTPHHHQDLANMTTQEVDGVLQTYLARYHALRQAQPPLFPFIFRNHGARAGASIAHPHSQIIATHFPPPRIQQEEAAAQERYNEEGTCPYCEVISTELETRDRLVSTNETYVLFVPFAARVPYEMWILPRIHEPEFGRLTEDESTALAAILKEAISRLQDRLDDPDYNFYVRTALDYESDAPHLHWSLRIEPRTSVEAGFERSTGIQVNPSIPERDAAVLRGEAG